jgi:hypothetical protein
MEMLKFECESCGYSQGVSEKYAGKSAKCPKCQSSVKIGNELIKPWIDGELVKFYCSACGKKLAAKAENCGRKVQCIKCKKEQIIPTLPANTASNEPEAIPILKADGGFGELLSMEANAEVLERPAVQPFQTHEAPVKQPASRGGSKSDKQDWIKKPVTIVGGLVCVVILFLVFHAISSALKGNLTAEQKRTLPVNKAGDYGSPSWDAMDFIRKIRKDETFNITENLSTTLKLISNKELQELSQYPVDVNSIALDPENSFIKKLNDNDTAYYMQYNFGPEKKDNVIVCVISRKGFKDQIHGFWYNFQGYAPAMYATEEGNNVYALVMIENFSGPFIWVLKYKVQILVSMALLGLFYSICMVSVYMKAGESGYTALIPVYNLYVLAQIGDKPGWMGLVVFFSGFIPMVGPVVAMVFMFIISIGVAKAFEKSVVFGFGLFLLPLIFYPVLAFSGRVYD